MKRVAMKSIRISNCGGTERTKCNRHMSHQTGAIFDTVPFQTTELIKAFKQPRPAQAMNKVVPTFQARGASGQSIVVPTKSQASDGIYLPGANKAE